MYVECQVPESYTSLIENGQDAVIEISMLELKLNSKVRFSANYINPNNRTFKIEVEIPDNKFKIKPNLNAKVLVNDYSNNNAVLINEDNIFIDSNNEKYVYLIDKKNNDNIVIKNIIKTGMNDGVSVEVLKGLKQNDEIVIEGGRKVADNIKVKIINN